MWKEGILSAIDSLILTTNSAFILTLSRFQVKEQFEGQSAVNIAWSTMDSIWYGNHRPLYSDPPIELTHGLFGMFPAQYFANDN
jgi:hypothetical protein